MDTSVFKSYDVRGIYPTQLTPDMFQAIGRALASKFSQIASQQPDTIKIAVGRDMRLGSPELSAALISGLTSGGVNVHDVGEVPIDLVYLAVSGLGYDGGVMVTASHNPAEYNGCKAVAKGMAWIRGTEVLEEMQKQIPDQVRDDTLVGKVSEADLYPQYLQHIAKAIDIDTSKPLKVVVDAGNGMAGKVIPLLQPLLPSSVSVELMFAELDGHFPNRPSNPLADGAAATAGAKVRELGATAGFMFDGDTDRLFTLDENGKLVRGDQTLLLLAKEALRKEPGTAVAYNLICSKAVPEFIARWGGKPVRAAVGFVNVAGALKEHGGRLSGEVSSHFAFRENAYADSGFMAFIYILNLLSREPRALSELVAEITPYFRGDEVNFTHSNIPAALAALKAKYADGQQDELDGLTVQYPTWWFNARPSNTEPLLRITLEANTAEEQKQREAEVVAAAKAAG